MTINEGMKRSKNLRWSSTLFCVLPCTLMSTDCYSTELSFLVASTSLVQWNCQGFQANSSEIRLLIKQFEPIAFSLQELLLSYTYTFINHHYNLLTILPPTNSSNRPHGRAGILVCRTIPTVSYHWTLHYEPWRVASQHPNLAHFALFTYPHRVHGLLPTLSQYFCNYRPCYFS